MGGADGTYLSRSIQRSFRDAEGAGNHGSPTRERSALCDAQAARKG